MRGSGVRILFAAPDSKGSRDVCQTSKTAYALKLAPLLFVRPGELRHAEWTEFDLDSADPHWRIPAEKMKMGEQHVVPLAKQALVLLRELRSVTGRGQFVFPSLRKRSE
jgi:integrase